MEFLLVPALLIVLGVVFGRSYERSLWERRLVDLRGLMPGELAKLRDVLSGVGRSAAAEPRQLADAVEAIAIEVERIGEGQRFLTKVLAEREGRSRDSKASSPLPGTVRPPLPPNA